MDILTAMKNRHSVREYIDKAIEGEIRDALQAEIDAVNAESGLRIQLVTDEPKAFDYFLAHYGKFGGVRNYIALVGKKGAGFAEKTGYFGQRVALKAQMLGLNTCWVAMTFKKSAAKKALTIGEGEKLGCVLSLGYGKTQGFPHKSKPMAELCAADKEAPEWFIKGMEAAMLAPTARNQQKFLFELKNGRVTAKVKGGFFAKVDLGIVKYHFETGSGKTLD